VLELATLALHGGPQVAEPEDARFKWPRITPAIEDVVMRQLHKELSIYDKSGVIGEFEDEFARYHERRHGLLFNSGTSAILAMFEGVNLGPETEVLCPVYTFHASVTPMAYLGARPVFCDVDDNGNLCLAEIKRRRTSATTAVVMTHMWGVPVADTVAIAEYCASEGLALLEDFHMRMAPKSTDARWAPLGTAPLGASRDRKSSPEGRVGSC